MTCVLLLLGAVTIWLALKIPSSILTYPDELFTAERSREMLLLGRGSVNFNFHHTFAKPPLQYWLTTLTLPRIENSSVAVRIWPLVYGMLSAAAVGWLAFVTDRTRPWLIPLTVAIYVSCPLFSTEAIRALLDTGLVLFTTLALCFAQLARRNPRWWFAVAITCWLGALQKIPLVFLIWLIVFLVRLGHRDERKSLKPVWLSASAAFAAALVSIWPLLQYWRFGMPLTRAFAGDDLETLFGQGHLGSRPYFEVLDGLLASGWASGSLALIAAIAFLPWRRRGAPQAVFEISITALSVIVLAIIFNFRSVRYVLPIVPLLSVVLAYALHRMYECGGKMAAAALTLIALVMASGFTQAEIKMHHRPRDASGEQFVAEKLGGLQPEGSALLLVVPNDDKQALRSTGFYLFHGKLRSPIKRLTIDQLRSSPPSARVTGVCRRQEFPVVQTVYPEAKVQLVTAGFVCWISGG